MYASAPTPDLCASPFRPIEAFLFSSTQDFRSCVQGGCSFGRVCARIPTVFRRMEGPVATINVQSTYCQVDAMIALSSLLPIPTALDTLAGDDGSSTGQPHGAAPGVSPTVGLTVGPDQRLRPQFHAPPEAQPINTTQWSRYIATTTTKIAAIGHERPRRGVPGRPGRTTTTPGREPSWPTRIWTRASRADALPFLSV